MWEKRSRTEEEEVAAVVERWRESIVTGNVAAAAAVRGDHHTLTMPDGTVWSKADELDALAATGPDIQSGRIEDLIIKLGWKTATARFVWTVEGVFRGHQQSLSRRATITFEKRGDAWQAVESRLENSAPEARPRSSRREGVRRWLRRARIPWLPASFQELAYHPDHPGEDYALPRTEARAYDEHEPLPIPPEELWLGYDYRVHGDGQVQRMLEITGADGFAFSPGDRILDFGCGAGRMIRHLQPLAATCEIWGTDISAPHITWCKRHLSPPFRFATTTKVPHLPFEDRSFRFVYCGSVFTHIDDLADAWLLELRRLLAPGGRLYVTIHDEHTIALIESGQAGYLNFLRNSRVYQESKGAFDMFTVGRDDKSQVFYEQANFRRIAANTFNVLSFTPEAYFYQTAVLLERR
jgi:SAM-dependent methyltransferase